MRVCTIFFIPLALPACVAAAGSSPTNNDSANECLPPASADEQAQRAAKGPQNVLETPLQTCSTSPLTGYFRTGRCETGPSDRGVHVVCSEMTEAFLSYTKAQGNDLSTPRGTFPGLRPGDRWCLCASRWEEARRAKVAPKVILEATDKAALRKLHLKALREHARPAEADLSN